MIRFFGELSVGNFNSGRRPASDNVKEFNGITRADRRNPDEPKPSTDPVVKPEGLSTHAGQVWDRLAPKCEAMGTLSPEDADAFQILCELRATAMLIARVKGEPDFTPLVVEATVDADGGTHVKHRENQILKMEKQNAAATRPYLDMFGLTPSSRPRLRVPKKADAPKSKWQAMGL